MEQRPKLVFQGRSNMYHSTRLCLLLLITTVGLSTGCTSFGDWGKAKEYVEWPLSRFAKDYQKPQRIAVIWSPDVMTVPGQPAMRGFGGRLYFYNEKSVAVPVKGELMIYGYEEPAPNVGMTPAKTPEKKTVPDKKFKFTPEQFAERFSKSDLGASYSIWIPWDEAGGNVKRVSLIPIFRMEGEQVVYGDPAELTLPGRTPEAVMARSQSYPAVNGIINGATGTYQSMQAGMQQPMTRQAMLQSANSNGGVTPNASQPPSMNGYPQTVYPAGAPGSPMPPTAGNGDTLLNGVSNANYNTQVSYPGAVNQASFQGAASNTATQFGPAQFQGNQVNGSQFGNVPSSGLKTTTIQLPPRVGNRLANPPGVTMSNQATGMGQGVNAMTPTAQTMLQMQAAGIDSRTQNTFLGQQHGMAQTANGGMHVPAAMNPSPVGSVPTAADGNVGSTSNPQLQQLPADFGPRKRQARVR